jgi:linoleoyl-CoA desaturase
MRLKDISRPVVSTILKLALPDKLLTSTPDDARETRSELKFRSRQGLRESFVDPETGKRRGLRTALPELRGGAAAA